MPSPTPTPPPPPPPLHRVPLPFLSAFLSWARLDIVPACSAVSSCPPQCVLRGQTAVPAPNPLLCMFGLFFTASVSKVILCWI